MALSRQVLCSLTGALLQDMQVKVYRRRTGA